MVLGTFANCKIGNLHQVKCKLNQTGYHGTLQYLAILFEMLLLGFELTQKMTYAYKLLELIC